MYRFLIAIGLALTLAACGGGVEVTPNSVINGAPAVTSSNFVLQQNTELSATLTASDPDNDPVTFSKMSDPANGQIVAFAANGAFSYRPNTNFKGADRFKVSGSDGIHSVTATITLNVLADCACGGGHNQAPTVTSAGFVLQQDTDLSAMLSASDPQNDPVTFSKTGDPVNGQIISFAANGAFTYHPNTGFKGVDRFKIAASDGTYTVAATITLTVQASSDGTDGAPTVTSASFVLDQDTDLSAMLSASDPQNDPVTFSKTGDPVNGQIISFAANGAFTYRPNTGFKGVDRFKITASDGTHSVTATVTLTVRGTNAAPTVTSVGFVLDQDTDLSATLTASDPENDPVTFSKTGDPAHGQIVSFTANGAFTYHPDTGFTGTDSFNIAASDGIHSVAATITLTVQPSSDAGREVRFSAWLGAADTQVSFPASAAGMEFYRSSAPDCDISSYTSCPDGQMDVLSTVGATDANSTAVVSDTAATLSWRGYYTLKDGAARASLEINTPPNFGARYGHQVVLFKNRLWLIGGMLYDGTVKNDVWSSDDGLNWELVTADAAFSPRTGHQVVAYKGQLWLIGGYDNQNLKNDVWSSSDGITWTQQPPTADVFPGRAGHQVVVYKDQLWLIGGSGLGTLRNDVWSSSDGVTWTWRADLGPRSNHQVVVYKDQLWLIGGDDGSLENDVWSSSDGITWTQQTAHADFSVRKGHQVVVYKDQLWLIGGDDGSLENDVWSSSDGITWTQQTAHADFPPRIGHQVVVYRQQLWVIGGHDGILRKAENDVWSSSDGVNWNRDSEKAAFIERFRHQAVVFGDRMWVIGGQGAERSLGDVMSSSDGITWTQQTGSAAFLGRSAHEAVVFAGRMWVVGGQLSDGTAKNDVWSSSDGITWTQQTAGAAFPARYQHQVVVYKDQLWLIGGSDGKNLLNDVWSSSDGITWTQQTGKAAFPARYGHRVAVFDGQLWLIGGLGAGGVRNDVWSSSDGITWTQRTASAAFPARYLHQVVPFKNRLWLIGGSGSGLLNDVWSSIDGINWTQQSAAAAFPAREAFQVLVYGDQLWLTGGLDTSGVPQGDVWRSSDGVNWRVGVRNAFQLQ